MEPFFHDLSEPLQPPAKVRIRNLQARLQADGRRVRVFLELTPFSKPPNGELRLLNSSDEELASANIIEAFQAKMELTLHLRGERITPPYSLLVTIYYRNEKEDPEFPDAENNRQVVDEQRLIIEGPN